VDVLFESAIRYSKQYIMAIYPFRYGKRWSCGYVKAKNHEGAITIAQNNESSIVYGMPKEALKIGAADFSLSIEEIIEAINKICKKTLILKKITIFDKFQKLQK